ncbi:uncharacterized protein CTHT_0033670 [Thermochaetoides thermophila DSM 1495]|uniref:DUF676 domain-containing protein n=1 Tax=Chaetomium thermophilum (strain DSM 1495 / CBS 144.50 / IMI 039719) TaxID=759272 RepID=G0S5U7_CHATD|nr:hypothetical protein CTHT_0033670 [Thermochaetoides thermophila DSM 1495]EGS21509.1 hypothetical protein CTHT_0033670 [Thermochaetoides thermophila DSM 1495]
MLLLHQVGSVKIGEVVRYTVTYKPSADHILPSPEFLYLRIKNTCSTPLRAAFVHGPYTLSVAAYPAHFKPFEKFENPRRYGVPEFEPMLKAGSVWNCHLVVPDNIRQTAGEGSSQHGYFGGRPNREGESASWIIEVSSQVLFSTSAAVHYEILLARDEKSLNIGSVVSVIGGQTHVPEPGRVSDFQRGAESQKDPSGLQKGVFSKAIHLKVEDTAALWNTPQLPGWDDVGWLRARSDDLVEPPTEAATDNNRPHANQQHRKHKPKKVHLVVLTHGLHSNLGSDMLFLKESIDAAVKQAKIDAKARRARERVVRRRDSSQIEAPERAADGSSHTLDARVNDGGRESNMGEVDESDSDDEEVIVRGYSGNATRTEKGIKYLGKRLAKYLLAMTYPDQPCLVTPKDASEAIVHTLKTSAFKKAGEDGHKQGSSFRSHSYGTNRTYKFTKISFIGHSLGGLVQTYAIAYIQKHSPKFFDLIQPVNFIALASPFLGLNHENPLYVKFALDFGLVGRTGQDLGLTWRAPTIARNGWGAIVSSLGEHAHKRMYGEPQPESKPLLRILPTGPAHKALKKFRNRTVYSNVVNDGIVPLRTSCLLFLDWQGLGRVEKARREAGLVETVVGFGWAELTGATVTTPRLAPWRPPDEEENGDGNDMDKNAQAKIEDLHAVPQPPSNATLEDDKQSFRAASDSYPGSSSTASLTSPLAGLLNFLRGDSPKPAQASSYKVSKIYQRGQIVKQGNMSSDQSLFGSPSASKRTAGTQAAQWTEPVSAPPKTTIFESAGDLLNPKLPSVEFLIDPAKRPRTIFHDRVYHPSDIPPPPTKAHLSTTSQLTLRLRSGVSTSQKSSSKSTCASSPTSTSNNPSSPSQRSRASTAGDGSTVHTTLSSNPDTADVTTVPNSPEDGAAMNDEDQEVDRSQMRVEEKIARAYHRGMSWRKVLVKLEPDAHNNIFVRRMFVNAFGWPVIQHLVQAHFSDAEIARTRDDDLPGSVDRARAPEEPAGLKKSGETKDVELAGIGAGVGVVRDSIQGNRDEVAKRPSEKEPHQKPPGVVLTGQAQHYCDGHAHEIVSGLGMSEPPASSSSLLTPLVTPRTELSDKFDSVTWSDRDWLDSGEDSDDDRSRRSSTGHAKKELGADTSLEKLKPSDMELDRENFIRA